MSCHWQFDLDENNFELLHATDDADPRLPSRRECHTCVVANNRILLFGGRFRGHFLNDTYEFELEVISLKQFCQRYIAEVCGGPAQPAHCRPPRQTEAAQASALAAVAVSVDGWQKIPFFRR